MKTKSPEWKEYRFVDIFEIKKGFYNKKPEHLIPGDIPFIGATDSNNGVTEYYSIDDIDVASKTGDENNSPIEEKIFPPHALCVTNNGSVGYAYYQEKEFTCSHDVNPLYLKKGTFNRYTALFVATVIKHDRYRWAYGRKWRPIRMVRSVLSLPSCENGEPDWEYMEQYIRSIETHFSTNNCCSEPINTSSWGYCKLGQIFTIINGKGLTKEEIEQNPGSLEAVQSGEDENGCIGYIDPDYCFEKGYTFVQEACLTVARSGSAGAVRFHPFGCVAGDSAKILLLKNKEIASVEVYLFLVTVLRQLKYKYSYGRKVTKKLYSTEEILLPLKAGVPDWEYMRGYISKLPCADTVSQFIDNGPPVLTQVI